MSLHPSRLARRRGSVPEHFPAKVSSCRRSCGLAAWVLLAAVTGPSLSLAENTATARPEETATDEPELEAPEARAVEVLAAPLPDRHPRAPAATTTEIPLRDRPELARSLAGPLLEVPSVALHRYGAPGSLVTASLRGSASDQVVVLLGGLPLTPPGGGSIDLSFVPPQLLESVSVVRGTEAAAFGAGALGGALDLVPLSPSGPDALTIEAGGGSFLSTQLAVTGRRRGRVSVAAGVAGSYARGDFGFERDATPTLDGDPWLASVRENNASGSGSVLLALGAPLGGGELRATGLVSAGAREVPGMTGFPTPGAGQRDLQAITGAEWRGEALFRPGLRAWTQVARHHYRPGETPSPSAGTESEALRLGVGSEVSASALWRGHLATVRGGLGAERFDDPGLSRTRGHLSVVLADRFAAVDPGLVLDAAVRLEHFTGVGSFVSPRVGFEVTPVGWLSVRGNVGRGARIPTLSELHAQTALVSPNPELRPERALTAETSAEARAGAFDARIAAYWSSYRDLITYELYPPLRLRPQNFRDARITGVEAEVRWRPHEGVRLVAGYGRTRAVSLRDDVNESGRLLPHRPPHRGLLRVEGRRGRLGGFAELDLQSAFPRNRANTKTMSARALLGAGARVHLTPAFSVALQGTNLLDARRLEDLYGYPLPGLAVFLSARLTLERDGEAR